MGHFRALCAVGYGRSVDKHLKKWIGHAAVVNAAQVASGSAQRTGCNGVVHSDEEIHARQYRPSAAEGAALPGGVLLFVDTDNAVEVSFQLP